MAIVNIHEAKAQLSDLIRRALSGEEVLISRRNVPLVRIVAANVDKGTRHLGWAKGKLEIGEDFDELPDEFAEYR